MKKKLRLKNWVKIVIALLTIIGLFALLNIYTENAINQCVNYGNSYDFCVAGLTK